MDVVELKARARVRWTLRETAANKMSCQVDSLSKSTV